MASSYVSPEIPGFGVTGTLHESAPRVVLTAVRRQRSAFGPVGQPVVLKTIAARYPRKQDVAEIRREFHLARRLAMEGVIEVYELVSYGEGNLAIAMEPFGRSLADVLRERDGEPLSEAEFYPLAISMAKVLGHLHERGVVHKDVVPRNVLLDEASGLIKFIDFGISSELSREKQSATIPRRLEGSLPYISPEQTGRMNRDVDYRSDYYSLGCSFFELLTGQLPFTADSALSWVHQHISVPSPRLTHFKPNVSSLLARVVERLMAKTAEDRYQSTFGLVADLEQARAGEGGSSFFLGQSDVTRRFQIPQRLYGREEEFEQLRERFDGVAAGETALCLVSGYSGVGKSALVEELSKAIACERGYLISGKFDQFKQSSAYSAFAAAIGALVSQLLGETQAALDEWATRLKREVGPGLRLMVELVPELSLIVGEQEPLPELSPAEGQKRFQIVFVNFLKVFAGSEHPLVIFLDDLQWSDVPTLNLLERLVASRELSHLLLIGAYRDNAVEPTHPLMVTLGQIEEHREIVQLKLAPLAKEAVEALVADTLLDREGETLPLAAAVFEKAQGNPLFVTEFLKTLHQEEVIAFEPDEGQWRWNLERVVASQVGEDVVDFMVGHLRKLPDGTQQMLQLAACIGAKFDLRTLAIISETSAERCARQLNEALRRNMILPLSESYRYVGLEAPEGSEVAERRSLPPPSRSEYPGGNADGSPNPEYRFQHDRVQQAAYELIAPDRKQAVHLSMARLIERYASAEELDERLIEVVGHFNEGRGLISDSSERTHLAELNLRAGARAQGSSAYDSALGFLTTGRELLPRDAWESQYALTRSLTSKLQQCMYLTADFAGADGLTDLLLTQVHTALEKADALSDRTRQYATSGRMKDSISAAIAGLELLGIEFSEDPTPAAIEREIAEIQKHLAGRPIRELIDAPLLKAGPDAVALRLLMEIFPAAFLSGSGNLFPYLVLKSVNLSLVAGNGPESAFAYAAYGMILCGVLDDHALGYEYGKLAVAMNEKLDDIALKSRVIYVYTMFIHHWSNHWSSMTPWFLRGIESGYQSGDMLYLAYSAQDCIIWDPKLDLEKASSEQEKYLRIVKDCEYRDSYDSGSLFLQMQLNFQGRTKQTFSLSDDEFDEETVLAGMHERAFMTGVANYQIYKAEIHCFYGDYDGALSFVERQDQMMASAMSLPQLSRFYIVAFLVRASLLAERPEGERPQMRARLEADLVRMRGWAQNCPENFAHLVSTMEAELARLDGRLQEALRLFDRAAAEARETGFRRDEGVALERAALALHAVGLDRAAEGYLRAARHVFYRWGAHRKVALIEAAYPEVFQDEAQRDPSGSIRYRTASTSSLVSADLDLASVIKASQAISGQIVLDQFWKKTLTILLENAGAERGRFVVRQQGELVVQAELGAFPAVGDELRARLPLTIIESALRTQKPVVLGDAAASGRFVADPYVSAHKPRSLLCIPLRSGDHFEGAIYFENNLAAEAFPVERVEIIKLLAAQAVISVENARLYEGQLRLTESQSRFVPSQFLKSLGQTDISGVELGQYVATEMSVLFADLRDFTPLAEQVGPDRVIELLNRYFSQVGEPVLRQGGFIDSYAGDEIMALFGVAPDRAVRAGVEMRAALRAFNRESITLGHRELEMGVGVNTGPLVLGTVGSPQRLKCGVVGDTVNLASRVEQLTKAYRSPMLIGEETFRQLEHPEHFSLRMVDRVAVKGKVSAVTLYEVLDAESDTRRRAKEGTRDGFEKALQRYLVRDFAAAQRAFMELAARDPDDPVFFRYAGRSARYLEAPPPEDWSGAEALTHK